MDALVLRVASAVLIVSFGTWAAFSLTIVIARARYDRALRDSRRPLTARQAERLVRRAGARPRTERGRWRRVSALARLARAHHPEARRLLRPALEDRDERVAAAAVRALGEMGDEWAVDLLVEGLRRGYGPRSRISVELERLAPAPGERLVPLLRDWNPAVRFWGATLLGPYTDLAEPSLITLTWDPDANVRAAAVEALGSRSSAAAGAAIVARLDDPEWFVRVHAARAAGHVLGAAAAPTLSGLLADARWWVRTAAKDALRGMGSDAVPTLLSTLTHEDPFARNGAAEVLQDIGFVDALALENPRSPLLERIYEAGGERLRETAELRAESKPSAKKVRAA